jgi:alpha-beta hydrolase superfamily lysophospholipase
MRDRTPGTCMRFHNAPPLIVLFPNTQTKVDQRVVAGATHAAPMTADVQVLIVPGDDDDAAHSSILVFDSQLVRAETGSVTAEAEPG